MSSTIPFIKQTNMESFQPYSVKYKLPNAFGMVPGF